MSRRLRVLLVLSVLLVVFIGACIYWYRVHDTGTASLIRRFPQGAAILSVDFAALRRAGILDSLGGSVAEEPDYKVFVKRTGFDYKRDLDTALLAFAPRGKYFLLRGRFDWKSLNAYAVAEGGSCRNSVCRMTGSSPDRKIAFFPLQSNLMAMAVSPDDSAIDALNSRDAAPAFPLSDAPVWIALPPAAIRSGDGLPSGTRMFARSMEKAQSVVLSLAPDAARFAARLEVRCRTAEEAAEIASQLTRTTGMLREFIEREHQKPNPADLSGVLTSGTFRSDDSRVHGYWPIERTFIDNLLAAGTT